MLKTNSFKRLQYVFKWKWAGYDENGQVIIEELDWLRPEVVLKRTTVTRQQFTARYRREGVNLVGDMQLPALIRITETSVANGHTQVVTPTMDVLLPSEHRLPICWSREKKDNGWERITVTYPSAWLVDFNCYPERMVYFLVNYQGESWARGSHLYLPRPTGLGKQEFWFDTKAGCEISLRLDGKQPMGESGIFFAEDVFTIG